MSAQVDTESLRIETVSRGRVSYVRLFGAIDETFDVDEILAHSAGVDLIINAKSVHRISSFGVRQWVNGMTRLAAAKNRILLFDCSPVMVKQINLVANFIEHCDVVSIQVPYFCKACGWETTLEHEVTAEGVEASQPQVSCKRCQAPMELDEDPASYFRFARPDRFRPLEPHIQQFIASYVRGPGAAARSGPKLPEPVVRLLYRAQGLGRSLVRRLPADRRLVWAAAGSAGVLLVVMVLLSLPGESGIPPESLQRYTALVQEWDFDGAARLLEQLVDQGQIPKELAASMGAHLEQQRVLARDTNVSDAQQAFAQKRYEDALGALEAAERIGPLPPAAHLLWADAARKLSRHQQAADRYATFLEHASEDDPRFDDALYWRADALVKLNRGAEARPLLEKVLSLKSNFRRSARRLLQSLP